MSNVSTELVTIEATTRKGLGKSDCRKIRKAGKIPANLYDKGKAVNIELDPKLLPRAWTSGKVFNLSFNGQTRKVLIKELQLHSVKRLALHVDLVYAE